MDTSAHNRLVSFNRAFFDTMKRMVEEDSSDS